jgi:glyoxylase-like metal-dependent hydrolase (beta-lactamase superfamily II)
MGGETNTFRVGAIQCTPVSDGSFPYPPSLFFANVSQQRLEEELRAHGLRTDEITGTYTCLLVSTGKNKVLVDTGAGKMAPSTGELLLNLEKAGARPSEIDTVILTHGHPDHIGGAVDVEGKLAFPNARYLMWKDEWEFWTSEEPNLSAMQVPEELKTGLILGTARRCLPPLRKQIELVEKESEVVPGIHLLPAPGHTPGHSAVAVSSGRDSVLYVADAVLHPILMEQPTWRTAFDLEQDRAAETRRRLLDRAAADKTKVMAFHFPFPTVGRVVAGHAGGWQWQPAS